MREGGRGEKRKGLSFRWGEREENIEKKEKGELVFSFFEGKGKKGEKRQLSSYEGKKAKRKGWKKKMRGLLLMPKEKNKGGEGLKLYYLLGQE